MRPTGPEGGPSAHSMPMEHNWLEDAAVLRFSISRRAVDGGQPWLVLESGEPADDTKLATGKAEPLKDRNRWGVLPNEA